MTSFLALWLTLMGLCCVIAFVWKAKTQTTAFMIMLTVSLIPTALSLILIPPDKDGQYSLLYSLPYLLAAAMGAIIGCTAAQLMGEESQS